MSWTLTLPVFGAVAAGEDGGGGGEWKDAAVLLLLLSSVVPGGVPSCDVSKVAAMLLPSPPPSSPSAPWNEDVRAKPASTEAASEASSSACAGDGAGAVGPGVLVVCWSPEDSCCSCCDADDSAAASVPSSMAFQAPPAASPALLCTKAVCLCVGGCGGRGMNEYAQKSEQEVGRLFDEKLLYPPHFSFLIQAHHSHHSHPYNTGTFKTSASSSSSSPLR